MLLHISPQRLNEIKPFRGVIYLTREQDLYKWLNWAFGNYRVQYLYVHQVDAEGVYDKHRQEVVIQTTENIPCRLCLAVTKAYGG